MWSNLGPKYADEVTKLWEKAVKAQPHNEELAREWFWGTVKTLDWRGAQKAAMNLQKTYTKRREYWFWAVISSLMLHVCSSYDLPFLGSANVDLHRTHSQPIPRNASSSAHSPTA